MNKRLKVMSMIVSGALAIAGCVSVESVRNQMSSSNPADVAAGEREIMSILTTCKSSNGMQQFRQEDCMAYVDLIKGKKVAWDIVEKMKDSHNHEMLVEVAKAVPVNNSADAKRLIGILTVKAESCKSYSDKEIYCALINQIVAKVDDYKFVLAMEKGMYNNGIAACAESIKARLAALAPTYAETCSDKKELLSFLVDYDLKENDARKIIRKLGDTGAVLELIHNDKIPRKMINWIDDEAGAITWLEKRNAGYCDNSYWTDMVKACVKSNEGLLKLTKASGQAIQEAAVKAMTADDFARFAKENPSPYLFKARISVVESKQELMNLLSVVSDNARITDLANRMKKVGVDVGEVAMSATEYSDVAFWAFFETKNDEVLKKIAKEHKLKLMRYMALERIDKAGAAAMVSAEAAKVKLMTGTGTVEGFGIGMSLEDAFFLAKKTFPESQPEVWRESGNTFRVVVTDGDKFTFATADYDSGKVFRLNFTPSMTKRLVGGATFSEQNRLIARKYGFVFKFEMISARLKIDNEFLKFLCNDDDDKWSVAHQVVYQQLGTDGVRVRYFEDERTECAEFGLLLATNTAFREYYKGEWETPEQAAKKLAKKCANDFETVLGLPGTLRIEKTK